VTLRQHWIKKGWILGARPEFSWSQHYALIPTPTATKEGLLRVYYSTTDADRVGYVTFADLDPECPARVVHLAQAPILGPGDEGCFDDCGVNVTSIVNAADRPLAYYVGYQRSQKTPYLLFSGAAAFDASAARLTRISTVPILDRIEGEETIRSAPTVLRLPSGELRAWYVASDRWETASNGKRFPVYGIHTVTSPDGVVWHARPTVCLRPDFPAEIGLGRPWALFEDGIFKLWFSVRSLHGGSLVYRKLGYAQSKDGVQWERDDASVVIECSDSGWDSEMICYPAVLRLGAKQYLFYNGNGNGLSGFGYAELDE
jgi:hypothetical protein